MEQRRLGPLTVSALGLGCMGMSVAYGRPDTRAAVQTINRALDSGVTLFDTADMYGAGANERFLGTALGRRREHVVLATKTGVTTVPVLGLPSGVNARPERIRRCVDKSLKRLGTEWIDLFYLHRVDPDVPLEQSVGAMADAVDAGKVRHLGISEVNGEQLRRAHATHPMAAVQMEWSLFSRDVEAEVLPVARELGIGVVAYSPLGRGMLTGTAASSTKLPVLDYRRVLPRWRRANLAHNLAQVTVVKQVAAKLGVTPAQTALAWLLARSENVVPIPGTTKPHHLDANLGALDLTLSPAHVAALESVTAAGNRYGSGMERYVATPGR